MYRRSQARCLDGRERAQPRRRGVGESQRLHLGDAQQAHADDDERHQYFDQAETRSPRDCGSMFHVQAGSVA
jgi:hypothetical protein